jgi:bifunctional N-acetylglucosamine-1-phosphate-uridyltransferase/glucosamine-1-phosphate-acetyltransferase GlmU-like protein
LWGSWRKSQAGRRAFLRYAVQREQLGTGHAVAAAAPELYDDPGDVLVVYGDMPLVQAGTYYMLARKHSKTARTAPC